MRNPFQKKRRRSDGHNEWLAVRFPDVDIRTLEIVERVQPYTMTSPERLVSLCNAVEYVVKNQVEGDFVECGVWRGGSMMAVAATLRRLGCADRGLWLYDTFSGMSAPTQMDIDFVGRSATRLLAEEDRCDSSSTWCYSGLNEVKSNLDTCGYPQQNIKYVIGPVEETLPKSMPHSIALLRLDTDWYESTYHELLHLYPRVSRHGVLIIDDYGHWRGCRKAVDEYFENSEHGVLLNRIDYTGRIAIKPNQRSEKIDWQLRMKAG